MNATVWLGMMVMVGAVAAGCRSAPTQGSQPSSSASASVAPARGSANRAVAQVVFVGQREACQCTRKRIDTTWAALEQMLAEHPAIEVKKIEQDVDQEAADRYDELESLMVAPGVYLMDGNGKLIQLLQGEVTVGQLEQAFGAAG